MIQISPTIQLEESGFGVFNHSVITLLLNSVEEFFRRQGIVSPKMVSILQHRDGPMCCATNDVNIHRIYLDTEGDRWCQWLYQFAHEYCHHLIDGGLSGETAGLKWFEESLCHVASFACLDHFERICATNPSLLSYATSVITFLRDLLTDEGTPLYGKYLPDEQHLIRKEQIPLDIIRPIKYYIEERMAVLTTTYSMDDYKSIARALFPFFYNNEKLWRIVPHLGNTLRWSSSQELFDCLRGHADDEYLGTLEGLIGWIV